MRRLGVSMWSAASAALALAVGGACSDEERPPRTAECPADETCSDLAPEGLLFSGSRYGESEQLNPVQLVAAGGTQTITAMTGTTIAPRPYRGRFDVTTAAPLDVVFVDPPDVLVTAREPGTAWVRVVEPGTDLLLDRVEVTARDATRIEPYPIVLENAFTQEAAPEQWALYADGGERRVVVRLRDDDGARLVDDSMTLVMPQTEAAIGAQDRWDRLVLRAFAAGDIPVAVTLGAGRFDLTIAAVSELHAVQWLTAVDSLCPSEQTTACVRGVYGTTAVVAALDWRYSFDGTIDVRADPTGFPDCVEIHATAPGTGRVIATAAGMGAILEVTVTGSCAATRR